MSRNEQAHKLVSYAGSVEPAGSERDCLVAGAVISVLISCAVLFVTDSTGEDSRWSIWKATSYWSELIGSTAVDASSAQLHNSL
jgi:hypothetical protein